MTAPDVTYGPARAVGLVAEREIRTRMRTKAFRIYTGLMMALMIVGVIVVKLVSGAGSGPGATVGFTGQTAALAQPLKTTATALDRRVAARAFTDPAAGRHAVADGDVDALVVGTANGRVHVLVREELDPKLRTVLDRFAQQRALDARIAALGGDPAQVRRAVADAGTTVTALRPPYRYDVTQIVLGATSGILVYLTLMMSGQSIAQGVVEEKSSRVVELLLATVRPRELMLGKVLGIGLLGLTQMVLIGAAALIPALATGVLASASAAVSSVVWIVVWFVLGFAAYALVFAGMGALVSRQEDVGQVTSLPLMLVIIGYAVGILVLPSDPGNHVVAALSLIPTFSPTLMPMRLLMGGVPVWQTVLALALTVAVLPVLLWLAARIYRNAIVRTGTKVRLREALRGD